MNELDSFFSSDGSGSQKKRYKQYGNLDESKVLEMYNQGFSPRKIAAAIKSYPNAVRRFLKRRGLTIRNRSTAAKSFHGLRRSGEIDYNKSNEVA